MAQAALGALDLLPGRSGPAIIAHRAGNSLQAARDYLEAGADYLEVDIWLHEGHFEARHERRMHRLPVLFEKWYLRRVPSARYGLSELLAETAGRGAGIFLDLKNGGASAAALLRRLLAETPHPERIVASSQSWATLRAVRERAPEVDAFYSIDVRSKLDLFLSVIDRDLRPRGVSCKQVLLTRRNVEALHDRGMLVVAWTVDDIARAHDLVSWGVDAITTHKVREMRREFVS